LSPPPSRGKAEERQMAKGKRQMAKVKSLFLVFGHWFLVRFLGLSSLFAAPRVSSFQFPVSSFETETNSAIGAKKGSPTDKRQRTWGEGPGTKNQGQPSCLIIGRWLVRFERSGGLTDDGPRIEHEFSNFDFRI